MPNLDDTIELLRQHRAEALERAEQACADSERFGAALYALGVDPAIDDGAPTRLAAAADLRPTATKSRPDPPQSPKATKREGRGFPASVDYDEVARVAREAIAAGEPLQNAVARHFGIEKPAASMRIRKARELGHDIPARNPNLGQRQAVANPPPAPPATDRSTLEGVAHLERLIAGEVDPDDDAA